MSLSKDELISLVRLAQSGDVDSFTTLVEIHEREIYGYLVVLLGLREEALDVSQQTFLNAWLHLSSLDDPSRFRCWLYTIARHLAQDYWRSKKASCYSREELGTDALIEWVPDCEEYVIRAELVQLALSEVTPKFRDSLLLRVVGGFSKPEIAQRMGISEQSVCTYVSYARKQFRHAYRRLEGINSLN